MQPVTEKLYASKDYAAQAGAGLAGDESASAQPTKAQKRQIGMSLPALDVEDLPAPEQVFRSRHIGIEEVLLFVLGPSVIALGISLGSGEWMLGPINVSQYGFRGVGWVILVSIILQVFYNVELGRYTLATGESPVVGFGRTPPGRWLWVPLALISFYMAFILGGWTVNAGASLFALVTGYAYHTGTAEAETVRILGILLLVSAFFFFTFGRKLVRTLEAIQGILMVYVLISLLFVTLIVVPFNFSAGAFASLVTPTAPPKGADPSLLGALAGFAALASGLNYMFIVYYRDHGYGMGYKTGYLSGALRGRRVEILPTGKTFPEDQRNAARWKRWFRYLLIDQWGIYFTGSLLGMMLPCILVAYLANLNAANGPHPDQLNIIVYAAEQLGDRFGPLLHGWALLTGFVLLYTTQMVVLDLLARNFTDAAFSLSGRFRSWIGGDARRFYYPLMIVLIIVISVLIHMPQAAIPGQLVVLSANLSNFAALIFPLLTIYLNRQLPRPARIRWWSYVVLIANTLFFGFFFINFLWVQIVGYPLVQF